MCGEDLYKYYIKRIMVENFSRKLFAESIEGTLIKVYLSYRWEKGLDVYARLEYYNTFGKSRRCGLLPSDIRAVKMLNKIGFRRDNGKMIMNTDVLDDNEYTMCIASRINLEKLRIKVESMSKKPYYIDTADIRTAENINRILSVKREIEIA